jgi:hypothetical protein
MFFKFFDDSFTVVVDDRVVNVWTEDVIYLPLVVLRLFFFINKYLFSILFLTINIFLIFYVVIISQIITKNKIQKYKLIINNYKYNYK